MQAKLKSVQDMIDLTGSGATWADGRVLRSAVGAMKRDPTLKNLLGEDNVDAIYSALTKDLGATAKSLGAESEWQNYNNGMKSLYNFRDNVLSKIVTTADKAQERIRPEDAATALLDQGKKGATDLAALQAKLPGAVGELASAQLHQGPEAWNNLSEQAKNVFVPDPAQKAQLDRLYEMTDTANSNAKSVVRDATRDHAAAVSAATADAKAGNFDQSTAVVQARRRLAAAKANAAPGNSLDDIRETLHGIKKSAIGAIGGNVLGSLFHSVPGGAAAWEGLGAIAPSVLKWGHGLITNPQSALIPASGAVAGENANALAIRPQN